MGLDLGGWGSGVNGGVGVGETVIQIHFIKIYFNKLFPLKK